MGETRIDVSVVVPCYNAARFLDQALCSVEQNSVCNLEVIVLDDGSTDDSLAIMRRHEARDARVRVIHKRNEGYGATVNRGFAAARGTYVAVLEPDDWAVSGAYDKLFELARAHGMPDVVKATYWRVLSRGDADGERAYGYLRGRIRKAGRRIRLADEPQLIQYHPSIWSALYARDFLEREGIEMVEAPGAGWVDNPFCVETMCAATSIVYTDEAYYCYREDLATASSAHVSARLMIDRWNERQDVLDSRGIQEEGILRANAIVALRFFARMLETDALEDEELRHDARAMARRLDPSVLGTIDCISPGVIAEVLRLADVWGDAPSAGPYLAHLAREAAWALRQNGPAFLVHNLMLARER